MTAKHTPGPWTVRKIDRRAKAICARSYKDRYGVLIDSALAMVYAERDLLGNISSESAATCEANARLIAAAPDLLATLRDAIPRLEDRTNWTTDDDYKGAWALAHVFRAAIDKAEGR